MSADVGTITMSSSHGFIVNELVNVSGMDRTSNQILLDFDNIFNGTYQIKSIPSPTSFTYDIPRQASSTITTTSRSGNVASITVSQSLNAVVGSVIVIEGLSNTSYNGTFTITQVLSSTTYVFNSTGANEAPISVTSGKVTLLTSEVQSALIVAGFFDIIHTGADTYVIGEQVTVSGLGATYNGTYTVIDTPQYNVVRFDGTGKPSAPATLARPSISDRTRAGSTVTITTTTSHNLSTGQYARVEGLDSSLNGTWIITVTGANTFTYQTPTSGTIESGNLSGQAYVAGASILRSRSVITTSDSGEARVSGSLPFAAYSGGTATIGGNITEGDGTEVESAGIAVKKADIPFTPGLTGAIADFGPDILEVNTLTRDVALNGSYDGARAKLDVLTDFFFLQPGNNEIEFIDDKNSTSTALLKVFYRSGWLG
jgi:hypothetical protein